MTRGIFAGLASVCALLAVSAGRALACLTDGDCNDGLFCTTDHCIAFVCFHFDRDCNDFNDCTNDSCNESQNQCTHDTPCGGHCEDFNIFTVQERCNGSGRCVGLPSDVVFVFTPTRCCVSADCSGSDFCVDTLCIPDASAPTPTRTRTRTPTRTATRTPTPGNTPTADNRPVLTINDVAVQEGDSGQSDLRFTLTLSQSINKKITVNYSSMTGSANAGSDYVANISGSFDIAKNTTTAQLPRIQVRGDTTFETDEFLLMNLTGVSNEARIGRPVGLGFIANDDAPPFGIGVAGLTPRDAVTEPGTDTPVTVTWTHPLRWRDLNTIDVRLRNQYGIALWLRFDEAGNTFTLIDPLGVIPGASFPPGSQEEFAGAGIVAVLAETSVQASGPEDPTVNLRVTLRFAPETAGSTYVAEAAASDDTGDVQDFESIGTITVISALPCPGDCNGDHLLTVDEIVVGVNIALGTVPTADCPTFDVDGSGGVEIGELIAAVNAALIGCGGA